MILFFCFTFGLTCADAPQITSPSTQLHSVAGVSRYHNSQEGDNSQKSQPQQRTVPNSWQGHLSASNFTAPSDQIALSKIKRTIDRTISALPSEHTQELKDLSVLNKNHVSRGMANSEKIILHVGTVGNQKELVAVLIHEIGHNVDLGLIRGKSRIPSEFSDEGNPIYTDDKSLDFYRISWKNEQKQKHTSERKDFVSGYAASDPFEDFAESYLFYRLHGDKFRAAMSQSTALRKKYYFMRNEVFAKKEFQLENKHEYNPFEQSAIFDATLLNFSVSEMIAKS